MYIFDDRENINGKKSDVETTRFNVVACLHIFSLYNIKKSHFYIFIQHRAILYMIEVLLMLPRVRVH